MFRWTCVENTRHQFSTMQTAQPFMLMLDCPETAHQRGKKEPFSVVLRLCDENGILIQDHEPLSAVLWAQVVQTGQKGSAAPPSAKSSKNVLTLVGVKKSDVSAKVPWFPVTEQRQFDGRLIAGQCKWDFDLLSTHHAHVVEFTATIPDVVSHAVSRKLRVLTSAAAKVTVSSPDSDLSEIVQIIKQEPAFDNQEVPRISPALLSPEWSQQSETLSNGAVSQQFVQDAAAAGSQTTVVPTMAQIVVSLKHIAQSEDVMERHWALVALHALAPLTGEQVSDIPAPAQYSSAQLMQQLEQHIATEGLQMGEDSRKRPASNDWIDAKRQELFWNDEVFTTELMTLGAKHNSREIMTIEINGPHPKSDASLDAVTNKVRDLKLQPGPVTPPEQAAKENQQPPSSRKVQQQSPPQRSPPPSLVTRPVIPTKRAPRPRPPKLKGQERKCIVM